MEAKLDKKKDQDQAAFAVPCQHEKVRSMFITDRKVWEYYCAAPRCGASFVVKGGGSAQTDKVLALEVSNKELQTSIERLHRILKREQGIVHTFMKLAGVESG